MPKHRRAPRKSKKTLRVKPHPTKSHQKPRRTSRRGLVVALLALGLVLLAFPTAYKYFTNRPATKSATATPASPSSDLNPSEPTTSGNEPIKIDSRLLGNIVPSQPPQRIVIPALKIDLPVVEAPVVNGYWETSETTASHGVGSADPGQNGNTVVFAHARDKLFGPLRLIGVGDPVYVLTKDRWFRYQVVGTQFVTPDQIQVIAPTDDETLTLFTCSGFLDSKRLIVTAKPLT